MTPQQRRILEVLSTCTGEMYGLDIVAAGAASRGSLYVELSLLEDLGWVEGRETKRTEQLPQRRLYRITPIGAAALLPTAKVVP